MYVTACFHLKSPLEIKEEEDEQEQEKKGCLMVMANPSDHSHGKKQIFFKIFIGER